LIAAEYVSTWANMTESKILQPPATGGFVPLIEPEIRGNEWNYVRECLETGWVSSAGTFVDRFEHQVAQQCGCKHAVATVNGTAALHVALLVAGVQPEDEVLVSTLTFIAPVNAIRYVGAWPVFIDSEPDYWQMDPSKVVEFLEKGCRWSNGTLYNQRTGRRVTAIVPVHILGHSVDLDPILAVAQKFGLKVIEDATEGLGATYKGRPLGSIGDIGCLSFNGNKIITTGGGGMLLTSNEDWAQKAKYLTTQAKDDPVEYIHKEVGYNYRLTNVQAAIGCGQMEQLDAFVAAKREIADRYTLAFRGVPGIVPMGQASWAQSTFWMYTVLIKEEEFGINSRQLLQALAAHKIQCRPLWQPMHQSPAHVVSRVGEFPVSDQLSKEALSLPCSVGLSKDAQQKVIKQMCKR
jgi:perosamine synthetase